MSSEIRVDPLSGLTVIVAPGRASIGAPRPSGLPAPSGPCPFCPGHESDAEATIASIGDPWQVRVVGNRFPLVSAEMPRAPGKHEVIVESREHESDLADFDDDELASVLGVYRDRSRALGAWPGARAVVLFRNRGRRAGSSQPHPHAQIVALPYVPPHVLARDAIASDPTLLRRVLDAERAGARVVREEGGFVTCCPFASSRAFEVRIVPTERVERFAHLPDESVRSLASHLGHALRGLRARMGLSDYNVLVRDPALDTRGAFFVIEILPRTGGDAGFELSTGSPICVVSPEETAAALRA